MRKIKRITNVVKIAIVFIFLIGLFGIILQPERTYAGNSNGTVCDPTLIRICSICGNDYDNPDVCPHHIDEMYHGTICTPTPGRICSICGGDYDDGTVCPHHEGEEYGGEECIPIRICDICGGNYDDGNECPHHEGESYGGEVCTVEMVLICNICGNDYNDGSVCSHLKDSYYDEWCEPENTRICSICGNDYDCAGLCPHHEGEIYNEEICTITRICNICGGNYEDGSECPHHEGDTYGGGVCTVYDGRICSICGYNYDNGNVCPHKTGKRYNGDICEVREIRYCNICGKNYDDPSECPHKIGIVYENIAYVFYIDSLDKLEKADRKVIAEFYNISEKNVISILIDSEQKFIDEWNAMGKRNETLYNIVTVEIIMHGTVFNMGNGEGENYITNDTIKNKLDDKKVGCIILSSCDVGNVDYCSTNIASNLAKRVENAPLIASDGTVGARIEEGILYYESLADNDFKQDSIDKSRDNKGWIIYKYKDKNLTVSDSKGKKFTIEQFLSLVA